mmetsp:Transcript_17123/g.66681  ORF Transcript_17123/g.66681 Transcript_17123/m.66681 type:complete len:202 (-) Transcript_17123:1701-2306(-)
MGATCMGAAGARLNTLTLNWTAKPCSTWLDWLLMSMCRETAPFVQLKLPEMCMPSPRSAGRRIFFSVVASGAWLAAAAAGAGVGSGEVMPLSRSATWAGAAAATGTAPGRPPSIGGRGSTGGRSPACFLASFSLMFFKWTPGLRERTNASAGLWYTDERLEICATRSSRMEGSSVVVSSLIRGFSARTTALAAFESERSLQ